MPWVTGQQIVAEVEQFTGQPYVWGGVAPGGFDCSGLVQYVLTQLGVPNVPRTSEEQYAWAVPVNQPSPGDLVFAQFPGDQQASPGHVGVYTGGGQVLSAQDPATGVQSSALATWGPYIVGYGRAQGEIVSGPQDPARQQQVTYYAGILAKLPGTYQGTYKQFNGMTWSALYTTLAAADTSADPKQLADAILGLEAAQRLGGNITQSELGLGKFVQAAENAAASTDFAAGVPVLDPLASIAAALKSFYTALTDGKMWRSFGWIVLGVLLLAGGIVLWLGPGVAKRTPAGAAAAAVA